MRWRSSVQRISKDEILTDVVVSVGAGLEIEHWRLLPQELHYAEVLGDQAIVDLEISARESCYRNFRGLLAVLGRRGSGADVPVCTVQLIAAADGWIRPPEKARFRDEDEFRAHSRWRLMRQLGTPVEVE